MRLSRFVHHISHVVIETPQPKMLGIDALSVVTRMQYKLAFRNHSEVKFVSHAMGILSFALMMNLPVAIRHYPTRPFLTAGFKSFNLLVKSICNRSFLHV